MVALAAENVDTTQDFQFSVTLCGGRLATIKVPVLLSKALPLPDSEAVLGDPFRRYDDLRSYQREVLQAG